MSRVLFLAALLAVSADWLAPAVAAQVTTADLVTWRARAERATPGADARVVLDAAVAPGWRLYALGSPVGIPLTVSLDPLPAGVTAGPLRQSEPQQGYDPAFELDYPYFVESGRVVQTLRVARGTASGRREVSGSIRYAVCDDSVCLPPTRTAFQVPLVVE